MRSLVIATLALSLAVPLLVGRTWAQDPVERKSDQRRQGYGSLAGLGIVFLQIGNGLEYLAYEASQRSSGKPAGQTRRYPGDVSEGAMILDDYEEALDGLRRGDKRKFERNKYRLLRSTGSARTKTNRDLAERLYSALPDRFENGFAFKREDGTLVKDPDQFIRSQLIRAHHTIFDGGDGNDDAD